jgi:hypothetical protein
MLQSLPSIFCPEMVAAYNEEDLQRVAAEMPDVAKRKQLRELHDNLAERLRSLRK